MSENESRQLQMTLSLGLFLVGILVCSASLFMPAVKHGKVLSGLELNAISTIMAFLGSMNGDTSTERTLMCRVLLFSNLSAFLMLFFGSRIFRNAPYFGYSNFVILVLCVLFLLTVPYSGIEKVYFGYYLWLFGLIVIGFSGLASVWKLT